MQVETYPRLFCPTGMTILSFEGVCLNYCNPDPRRGEPRVGSAPDVAFPEDPEDPLDPLQNSGRFIFVRRRGT